MPETPCLFRILLTKSNIIKKSDKKLSHLNEWEQILSGAVVCHNALIAATALGYHAQWLTEWPAYDEDVKTALGLLPTDRFLGFIYIGTASEPPVERARPELEDVVAYWQP